MLSKTIPMKSKLEELLRRARKHVDSMTPEQRRDMLRAQARSWARGEAGMGSDADEAAYARALHDDDQGALARLKRESGERVARVNAMIEKGDLL